MNLFICPFYHQRSFPYISAMVNNGSVSYDHGKDGRSSELGGCSAEIRNRDHDTYLAIRYSKGRLTVCRQTRFYVFRISNGLYLLFEVFEFRRYYLYNVANIKPSSVHLSLPRTFEQIFGLSWNTFFYHKNFNCLFISFVVFFFVAFLTNEMSLSALHCLIYMKHISCRWWLTWMTRTNGRSASILEAFVFLLDISLVPQQLQEICPVGGEKLESSTTTATKKSQYSLFHFQTPQWL